MPSNYYQASSAEYGKMSISKYVFLQIAEDSLESLAKNELKKDISLALPKGKKSVEVSILKDKIAVHIAVLSVRGSDVKKAADTIQQEVYNDLYDATEISSIQVNVEVVGFVDAPKKA